ncbi:MAG TPA: RsmG family class I SAM-dependent methyltransferase [Acidimicrobiia bacterium]|nr:RsmG family class I SAM-dependent methyltransferase [Acidimicrobiia bacterium]
MAHGRALLGAIPEPGPALDLGSGGGIPGLVLATARPDLDLTLLEARRRACAFLREAVGELGLGRVRVVEARAEDAARRPDLRETFVAVVSRSFGPPAVTAECAVGFLRNGGVLIVSEPPSDEARWPDDGLERLGLSAATLERHDDASFVRIVKVRADDRWPRRVGIPAKRPVWT